MEEALRRKKEEEMKQVAEHGDRRRGRRRNRDNEEGLIFAFRMPCCGIFRIWPIPNL